MPRDLSPDHIRCCVPYCGRTFKSQGEAEVICGKHWRAIPERIKARRRTIRRLIRKALMRKSTQKNAALLNRLYRSHEQVWQRGKAAAIEIAMGVSA